MNILMVTRIWWTTTVNNFFFWVSLLVLVQLLWNFLSHNIVVQVFLYSVLNYLLILSSPYLLKSFFLIWTEIRWFFTNLDWAHFHTMSQCTWWRSYFRHKKNIFFWSLSLSINHSNLSVSSYLQVVLREWKTIRMHATQITFFLLRDSDAWHISY